MCSYSIICNNRAKKDYREIRKCKSKKNTFDRIISEMKIDPLCPVCEKLSGKLKELYSKRLNANDRIVYDSLQEERLVYMISLLTHYEGIQSYTRPNETIIKKLYESKNRLC